MKMAKEILKLIGKEALTSREIQEKSSISRYMGSATLRNLEVQGKAIVILNKQTGFIMYVGNNFRKIFEED